MTKTLATTRNGKKRHNWTTTGTVVDPEINLTTRRFLDDCSHLTPARMADLDNLIDVSQAVRDHNAGITIIETSTKPNEEVIDALDKDQGDWMDAEPTAAALRAIDRE